MGRPIIQFPQSILDVQKVKSEWAAESGVALGDSLKLPSSMHQYIGIEGRVIGFDINIRVHNHAGNRLP